MLLLHYFFSPGWGLLTKKSTTALFWQMYRPFHQSEMKGIAHFEIKFWYVLAYLKGIQDVETTLFPQYFQF